MNNVTGLKRARRIVLAFALAFAACFAAHARQAHLLTSDTDLSSSLIHKVFYSSDGYVWIATEDGLNRYDGSRIVIYKNVPGDSTSLANNYVNDVFEDNDGTLYVATHGGLQIYDRAYDKFTPIAKNEDGTPHRGSASTLLKLANGDLWVFGNEVMQVDNSGGGLRVRRLNLPSDISQCDIAIQDVDGSIWVSKEQSGVFRILPNNSVKRYLGGQSDPVISSFALGPDNVLYAGSAHRGLYRYDRVRDRFESMAFDAASRVDIKQLYFDERGFMLLATDGAGLMCFNPRTGVTFDMPMPIQNYKKLKVHTITRDEYGNYWLGLYQKGLLMVPAQDNGFHTISQMGYESSIIGSSCITAIYRDSDNVLWLGTDNDGIYAVAGNMYQSRHISEGVPAVIQAITEDSQGKLWVGSYNQGFGSIDKKTGKYAKVPVYDENGIEVDKVFDIEEISRGKLLLGTMGNGLFAYDMATGKVEKDTVLNRAINRWITDICYSPRNECVYVCSYDGLYRVRDGEVEQLLQGIIINTIYDDKDRDILWLATPTGITSYSLSDGALKNYNVIEGKPSNSAYSIQYDGQNLWIGTNSGLARFNPETETFTNYYVDDGLHSNEFYKRTSFHDERNNTMFFGGVNGVTYFDPNEIISSGKKYELRITGFYIGETPVKAGMKSGKRVIIDQAVSDAKVFKLAAKDNSFSVEFNTKEFNPSSQAMFLYSFDGNKWETMPRKNNGYPNGSTHLLTFSKVKSGKHTLRIKAVENGVESDPVSINIDIAPRWYNSLWAKILYLILFLCCCWVAYRIWQIKSRARALEAKRLRDEEIKESKLQFFTNISHEIRTPLTLVISPLQKLVDDKDKDKDRQAVYRTMLRNAQRILRLVNELMDLRKIDNNQMKFVFSKINVKDFVSDVFETFTKAAEIKGVGMSFDYAGCEDLEAWVDKSNFDKIMMNLLSNAVKYTPSGGKVDVKLVEGEDPECDGPLRHYFQISVTDTGIGIPKKAIAHIFERFYQVANNNTSGTGIGLHLTHSLVELHHGSINIEDNPEGKGTSFIVRLPMGNDHLQQSDLVAGEQLDRDKIEILPNREALTIQSALTPDAPSVESKGSKNSKSVYVVEDDQEVRSFLVDMLSKEYFVTGFENGEIAFEEICKSAPDLLITDVMMPGIDGLTLTRKIKQNVNLNHIPVVMLTAKNREEDNIEGLESGADAYMTKPFNIDILRRTVRNLIDNNQRLRNVYSGNQNQEDKLEEIHASSNDEKLMERVMKVINKHLSDSEITIEMIAEEIGISRVHLHRKLKELTNQTTRDFIRNIRLQQAAKLLREKKLTVAEVSYLVGFKHPNNFSTNFKEMFGMSPTAYSEMHHGNSAPPNPSDS